jgi:hypothetical protein
MTKRLCATIAVIAILLTGCNGTFDIAAPLNDDHLYAQLYPYYAELCAVSQIKKKPGFGADTSGGIGGHAVFYLNGVCRASNTDYPTLVMCGTGTPTADQGVGLSVNAHFKNANWVATDGHDFFFQGGLSPQERLTRAAYDRIQADAKAKKLYDGIVFHPEVFDDIPPGMDQRDYKYEVSIATDYAIGIGRDRYCARTPVSRAQMIKMVDYLNGVNAIYRDGKKDFEWNVLENNCAYLAHNALAAAGLWDEWKTGRFILIAAFDFPVPKNEFVNQIWRTNDMDIADPHAVYADTAARRELIEDNRLPTEPGALAAATPVMQNNDIYNTDLKLIFYDQPAIGSYERRFRTIFSDPRYTDIRANLRYFASLYQRIEAARPPAAGAAPTIRSVSDFAAFSERFYDYIDHEAATVRAQLTALDTTPLGTSASR